jgi:3-isopropylmalate/(R)-2-methylmalate dehydratase small subunit
MKTIISTAVVLNVENIDTDQIIPAKFLKSTSKDGFGDKLFYNWRYDESGNERPDFILKSFHPESEILIAGNNFGCGSSREHAAWAIADYGFKTIITTQFADIFKANALNNGILPIVVSEDTLRVMTKYFLKHKDTKIHINLEAQELTVSEEDIIIRINFDIDPLKKKFLMEGITELEYLLQQKEHIIEFESNKKK